MRYNLRRSRTLKYFLLNSLGLVASTTVMLPNPADSAPPPTQVSQCADTFIQRISTRLVDGVTNIPIAESGTSVILTNGIYLVSYSEIQQLKVAKPNDKVKLCLLQIPEHCPPGDNRGRKYSLLNYRTNGYIEMYDSEHLCGGA